MDLLNGWKVNLGLVYKEAHSMANVQKNYVYIMNHVRIKRFKFNLEASPLLPFCVFFSSSPQHIGVVMNLVA